MGNIKITCVDDEVDFLDNLVDILKSMDFQVKGYSDGFIAANDIEVDPPDIIITDMKMPGVHGLMMLFTAKRVAPDAHLVVLSGNSKEENENTYNGDIDVPYYTKPLEPELFDFIKSLKPKERVKETPSGSNSKSPNFNLDSLDKLAELYKKYNDYKYKLLLYEFNLDGIRPKDFMDDGYGEDFFVVFDHLTGEDEKTQNEIIAGFKKQYGFWGDKVRGRISDFIPPFEFDVGDGAPAVIFLDGPGSFLLSLKVTGRDIERKNELVFRNFKLEVEPNVRLTIDGDEIVLNQYTGILNDHVGNNLDYIVKISDAFRDSAQKYKNAHIQNFWFYRAFNYNFLDFEMHFCDPINVNLESKKINVKTLFRDEVDLKFKENEIEYFLYLSKNFDFSSNFDPAIPARTRILSNFIPPRIKLEIIYDKEKMKFSLLKNDKLVEIDKKNTFYHNETLNDEYEFSNHDIYRSSSNILYIWGYIVRKRFDSIDEIDSPVKPQVESKGNKKTWLQKLLGE